MCGAESFLPSHIYYTTWGHWSFFFFLTLSIGRYFISLYHNYLLCCFFPHMSDIDHFYIKESFIFPCLWILFMSFDNFYFGSLSLICRSSYFKRKLALCNEFFFPMLDYLICEIKNFFFIYKNADEIKLQAKALYYFLKFRVILF